ncbi:ABC transporter permease [Actinomyces sp. 2119]|uniref:ABC transporter permease n=1 Tax=Actinomyces lilanjuaniae TaxID=2321394 RepID=A0ABM6Z1C9_9ACTO|nr:MULTISPECIES: ABC transporter permease [Actinomyces]AYD88994.1 ABC transporter permease [Actinomyces lilanjuaniae]RJF41154.1 ABC transporter permease [Actinomyces sp. 2119]
MSVLARSGRRVGAWRPVLPALGVLAAVSLWWLLTDVLLVSRPLVAQFSPVRTPAGLGELAGDGALLDAASASVFRLVGGLTLAVVVGTLAGLVTGSWRSLDRAASPVLLFLRMVSPLSWAPVVIIALGVGDRPVVALVAAAAVWPVLSGVADGVRRVDPGHLAVARSLGATRGETLHRVVWPTIRPALLAGVRQALGIAWVVLVPAEMLGVSSGLGYQIMNAKDQLAYHHVTALILVIGSLGYLVDTVARWALSTRRDRQEKR